MRKLILKFVLTAAALGVIASPSFAAVSKSDLMAAAKDLGHRYDANYAAKSPTGMAELYATDGLLVSPAGPGVRGRQALIDYYKKRFASGATGHHIDVREVHVQGNGGYSVASFSVTVPGAGGQMRTETGSIVAVYRRDKDGWHFRLVEPSVPETKAN